MTIEWQDAMQEAEGPQENLVLGTQLPATSQGRGTRTRLESLLVFLRVLEVMGAFPKCRQVPPGCA